MFIFPVLEGLELLTDLSQARWVEERLWTWKTQVLLGALLPDVFPAYARVLHPASLGSSGEAEPVRWSTVASWTGATVHPRMQFGNIAKLPYPYEPSWGEAPEEGIFPGAECRALVELLREFTATPDTCYSCYWEGYGDFDPRQNPAILQQFPHLLTAPKLTAPERAYFLFRGTLDIIPPLIDAPPWHRSPSLWWPEDRAWCVATDLDLYDTFVGGSPACIERILQCPDLETFPATIDTPVDVSADTINPLIE